MLRKHSDALQGFSGTGKKKELFPFFERPEIRVLKGAFV